MKKHLQKTCPLYPFPTQPTNPQKTRHLPHTHPIIIHRHTPAHCVKNPHKREEFHTHAPPARRKFPHFSYICIRTLPRGAHSKKNKNNRKNNQKTNSMTDKQQLRRYIAQEKKKHSSETLDQLSDRLLQQLEQHPRFRAARTLLLYHSLPDEVRTHTFIERWSREKHLILPAVLPDNTLELRHYTGPHDLRTGAYGISEPVGQLLADYRSIDLALIPGVAFDSHHNRLGRGKGYYDRLLPQLPAYKIGLCFHFQLLDGPLPTEPTDIPMDEILTDQGTF